MPIELKVPEVGESITEVQIGTWKKREGEGVAMDDSIVEIESDKATVDLPAPAAGTVTKILKASRIGRCGPGSFGGPGRPACRRREADRQSGRHRLGPDVAQRRLKGHARRGTRAR